MNFAPTTVDLNKKCNQAHNNQFKNAFSFYYGGGRTLLGVLFLYRIRTIRNGPMYRLGHQLGHQLEHQLEFIKFMTCFVNPQEN